MIVFLISLLFTGSSAELIVICKLNLKDSEWGVTLVLRVDWELDVGLAIPEPV